MNGYMVYIYVCMYKTLLLFHKKEYNFTVFNNMDGPRGYYTK